MSRLYAVLFVACASCENRAPTQLFVTTANDGDGQVSIGMVVEGDHITAYACADDAASDPYPGWFVGTAAPDGHFDLVLDGWSFSGSLTDDAAEGAILEPNGKSVRWSSPRITSAGLTGLYRDDSGCTTGVIVLDEDPSSSPIVRGAWCNVEQVTPVMPLELVEGRLAVDIAASEPWRVYVTPVRR